VSDEYTADDHELAYFIHFMLLQRKQTVLSNIRCFSKTALKDVHKSKQ